MKGQIPLNLIENLITLPPADLKISRRNDVYKVFDPLRKKEIILTEEELVRQRFVAFLINELNYPPSLMANEIGLKLNDTYKRCDTVVFSSDGKPLMIIEYKSPRITISQDVFNQILRYNIALNAGVLIVSNGISHYCCKINKIDGSYIFVDEIPSYQELKET